MFRLVSSGHSPDLNCGSNCKLAPPSSVGTRRDNLSNSLPAITDPASESGSSLNPKIILPPFVIHPGSVSGLVARPMDGFGLNDNVMTGCRADETRTISSLISVDATADRSRASTGESSILKLMREARTFWFICRTTVGPFLKSYRLSASLSTSCFRSSEA